MVSLSILLLMVFGLLPLFGYDEESSYAHSYIFVDKYSLFLDIYLGIELVGYRVDACLFL